jgi:hypothetical protein
LPAKKAIVCDGRLHNDPVYDSSGNVGRWIMNTMLRPTDSGTGRDQICTHMEFLTLQIELLYTLLRHDRVQQESIDKKVVCILRTIANLVQTYQSSESQIRLEGCRTRLLYIIDLWSIDME